MIQLALWVASAIFLALVGWFAFCMISGIILQAVGTIWESFLPSGRIRQPKSRT